MAPARMGSPHSLRLATIGAALAVHAMHFVCAQRLSSEGEDLMAVLIVLIIVVHMSLGVMLNMFGYKHWYCE